MDSNSTIRRSETFASVAVSETLARFCCYLCAAAVTMPYSLRRRLSGSMQQAGPERSAELERLQAERLARFTLRVFASAALRSVGLERDARECKMVDTEPIDAAYAASRAQIEIPCITSERKVEDHEAVAEIVATAAKNAYCQAINEVDLVVPMAGDHAALSVIAWEILLAKSPSGGLDIDWLWKCTARAVDECLGPTAQRCLECGRSI
jgi:hypothetical protein